MKLTKQDIIICITTLSNIKAIQKTQKYWYLSFFNSSEKRKVQKKEKSLI